MAKIISVALQKGGVGKSTTAQALASTLGSMGKKVLLIDLDSQGNVTYSSGVDVPEKTITDVLGEDCTAEEALVYCKYYDLLTADSYLTNVEVSENVSGALLKDGISSIANNYDYIVIDTPPALGNLLNNALTASDYVIIPTEARPFALQGLSALYDTIQNVQNRSNSNLKVLGILLIKYHSRSILNRDIRDMICEYADSIHTSVFNVSIREGIAVAEAQTVRQPLIDYAKNSKPNIDYEEFAKEVLKRMEGERG